MGADACVLEVAAALYADGRAADAGQEQSEAEIEIRLKRELAEE